MTCNLILTFIAQTDSLTIIFITLCAAVLCALLFFIKKLRSSLNEAHDSNAYKQEQLQQSMNAGHLTAWGYDIATKRVHNIYGNSPFDQVPMEKMAQFIHHEDSGKFNKALLDLESGVIDDCNIVIRVLHPRNGEYLDIDCSMKAVKGKSGKTVEIVSIQKNITDVIKQRKECDELMKRMSVIFNNNSVGMTLYDKYGNLADLNKEICDILGIDNKDMLVEAHPSLLDNPNISDETKQRILKGERFTYKEHINFTKVKLYKFYASSRYDNIVLERKVSPIFSANGEYEGSVITSTDITSKVEMESSMQKLMLEQERIFNHFPVGIAIFDNNGTLKQLNKALLQMFHIKKDNFSGDDAFFGILFNLPFPKNELERIKAGESGEFTIAINSAQLAEATHIEIGEFNDMWTSVRFCAMMKNGNVSSYILIVRDITQMHLHNLTLQRANMMNEIAENICNLIRWSYYSDTHKFIIKFGNGNRITIDQSNINDFVKTESVNDFYQMLAHFDNNEPGIHSCLINMDISGNGRYDSFEIAGSIRKSKHQLPYTKSTGYIRDNSEHNNIISKLKDANLLNKLILANTDAMMIYANTDGKVLWENVSDKLPAKNVASKLFKVGAFCFDTHGVYKEPCVKCLIFSTVNDKKKHYETKQLIDGSTIRLESSPVFDDDEKVSGVAIKVVDVTKQQKIEAEIKALRNKASDSQLLFHTIIEYIPASLFVKDVTNNFNYVIANREFCQIMNYTEEQLIGKNDFSIMPEEKAKFFYESDIETVKLNGKPYINEYLNEESGELHYIRTTKILIDTADRKLLIGITADITNIKRTNDALKEAKEHAEQSDKLKSAFLANMSHEIRTPLNAIVGFSQLLKEAISDDEREQYIEIINTNNQLLLRLINDILDLSKIDSGSIELQPIEINIEDLFMEVTSAAAHLISNNNVKLITESPYTTCLCTIDKDRLLQIWNNFTTNAIKYTSHGHIKIGYECRNNGLYIYVEDTGVGIDDSVKSRIFERFEKLNNYAQGCGLGLAICKALVELFNGKIGFKSEKGKGSFFWAWIPAECKFIPKNENADCHHDNLHIN